METIITLNDAIKYCDEVAVDNESMCEYNLACSNTQYREWKRCANAHRQLKRWLKELKTYRNGIEKIKEQINDYKGQGDYESANAMEYTLEMLGVLKGKEVYKFKVGEQNE